MLVVTEVKIMDVDRSSIEIVNCDPSLRQARAFSVGSESTKLEDITVKNEIIEGDQHILSDGRRLTIGISQKVRDVLGIPIIAFNNIKHANEVLHKKVDKYHNSCKRCYKLLDAYKTLSFWGRLKFLCNRTLLHSDFKKE